MSHQPTGLTQEQANEVAEKIATAIEDTSPDFLMQSDRDAIVESLLSIPNLTLSAPVPDGAVKVRIAVSRFPIDASRHAILCREIVGSKSKTGFEDGDTHRAIVEAWLPPVANIPVVQATTEEGQ